MDLTTILLSPFALFLLGTTLFMLYCTAFNTRAQLSPSSESAVTSIINLADLEFSDNASVARILAICSVVILGHRMWSWIVILARRIADFVVILGQRIEEVISVIGPFMGDWIGVIGRRMRDWIAARIPEEWWEEPAPLYDSAVGGVPIVGGWKEVRPENEYLYGRGAPKLRMMVREAIERGSLKME
ncbi:MAG: hypothetical protein Q9162_003628 [Coniocarpon cinnabarinum]